jgi:hypothetical protein
LQPNGGVVSTSTLSFTTGTAPITLPTPTYVGYSFAGWFSAPTGGVLVGGAGTAIAPTSPETLYAQWQALPTYTVTFVSNGSTTSISPVDGLVGSTATIPASATLSLPGFTFEGWNTLADGSGVTYAAGQSFTPTGGMDLYAQWRAVPTLTINFNLNGASGQVTPLSAPAGSKVTVPSTPGTSRPGYRFVGWATTPSGSPTLIGAGATVTLGQSEVLYAQWRAESTQYLMSAVGPFATGGAGLSGHQRSLVSALASRVAVRHFRLITLYGYVSSGRTGAYARSMSLRRAEAVATALRAQLAARGVRNVKVRVFGEGAMAGRSGAAAREVEVFAR